MNKINVLEFNNTNFRVTVIGVTTTTHEVTVQADYAQKLTVGKISTAQLVKKSFEFLLERESNTSILRSFDLSVIAHYFPEYEKIIVR
jgi:RNA polymerase-interacting CarD/CdnL/TRCF family regulator